MFLLNCCPSISNTSITFPLSLPIRNPFSAENTYPSRQWLACFSYMSLYSKFITKSDGFGTIECKEFIRWPYKVGEDDKLSKKSLNKPAI